MYERKRINARIKTPENYVFPDGWDFGGEVLQPDLVSVKPWYCKFNRLDNGKWECFYLRDNGDRDEELPAGSGDTPEDSFESLVRIWSLLRDDNESLWVLISHMRDFFEDDGYPSASLLDDVWAEDPPEGVMIPFGTDVN